MTPSSAPPTREINVSIRRGDHSGGQTVHYQVPQQSSQTVLDVVTWIQRNLEPGLSYRFSCRVGMCGSCAMMVNGRPRWTCRTHVRDVLDGRRIELAPLRNLPVIRDLVCDMSKFFAKWQRAQGRFHPTSNRTDAVAKILPASAQRIAADAGIECINCAVCYAACDVVAWSPDYLGPAALNRAWTLVNDVRDGGHRHRLHAISARGGCQNCHSQQGCSSHCPVQLNPARAIAGLKQLITRAVLKGQL